MKRGKKIVLISHCILNVNAKVEGIANYSSGLKEVICTLIENDFGIIQLPCIEQAMGGINRWGQVKEQLDFHSFRDKCKEMLIPVINQVEDFYKNGYEISAVIGVDGSPTCGVSKTCSGKWNGEICGQNNIEEKIATLKEIESSGVMMEELKILLELKGIDVRFFGINESNPQNGINTILENICKKN